MNYRASPNSGDIVASLFLSDPLDCEQYHQVFYKRSSLEPEQKLMLAVLADAVACFQNYASPRNAKEEVLFRDAEGWFLEENRKWLFSFENICDALEFDPEYVRQGLRCWRQMKLGHGRKAQGVIDIPTLFRKKTNFSTRQLARPTLARTEP